MNPIDFQITRLFCSLADQHPSIDSLFFAVASSYLLKGQIVMLMFWWVWFSPGSEKTIRRQMLVSALLACVLGLAVGRMMVASLPPRPRPIDNPIFHFNLPISPGQTPDSSSFPSDHAILFFALATGIFLASRPMGALALCWVIFVVCLPRLWLGFHHVSDIVAGAVIGSSLVLLLKWQKIRPKVSASLVLLSETKPQLFYVGLFLLSYQVTQMFNPVRHLLVLLHHPSATTIVSIVSN